jgi:hypothetical protein
MAGLGESGHGVARQGKARENIMFEDFENISSGHLDGAKYDSFEQKLRIRFQNGSVYTVHGVSPEDYRAFMDAPSQGAHYHANFKANYHVEKTK